MNFFEIDIEDFQQTTCLYFAGIVGVGFIHYYENPTNEELEDPDFWTAKLEATPHKYFALKNTRGEYSGGEPVEEEDLVGTRVTGAKHTLVFETQGLIDNWEFWDEIRRNSWKIVFVNKSGLMYYVDRPCSIHPKIVNPKNTTSAAFYQTEIKWQSLPNPVILNSPDGIFFGDMVLSGGGFDYTLNFSFS